MLPNDTRTRLWQLTDHYAVARRLCFEVAISAENAACDWRDLCCLAETAYIVNAAIESNFEDQAPTATIGLSLVRIC